MKQTFLVFQTGNSFTFLLSNRSESKEINIKINTKAQTTKTEHAENVGKNINSP